MKVGILDIGTDKICCFIVILKSNSKPEIIGMAHQKSKGVKSGVITDMELAQNSIVSTIQTAEQMTGDTVEEFVVNFSSNTIQSNLINLSVPLDGNEINAKNIKHVNKKAEEVDFGKDRILIHKINISYTIDGHKNISSPIGMKGNQLIAGFNLITADKNSVDNFMKCLSKCHLRVSHIVVTPYASGLGCLTDDDFYIGTTVIDIGGGSTSIAHFYDNKLIYTNIFELGGLHISSDIARGLSTSLFEADRLKILYGNVIGINQEDDFIDVPLTGNEHIADTHKVPKKFLNNIITSRIEEIFQIVKSKISKSILNKNYTNNIVLTGNTAQIKGCCDLASNIFGTKVRLGKPINNFGKQGLAENMSGPGFSVPSGLIKFKILEEKWDQNFSDSSIENSFIWRKFGTWVKESFF